jgi:hypothetical protein
MALAAVSGCSSHHGAAQASGAQLVSEIATRAAGLPTVHGPSLTCDGIGRTVHAAHAVSVPASTPTLFVCHWTGAISGHALIERQSATDSPATEFVEACENPAPTAPATAVPTGVLHGPACWQPIYHVLHLYEGDYRIDLGSRASGSAVDTEASSLATAELLGL